MDRRFNDCVSDAGVEFAVSAVKYFRFGDSFFESARGIVHFRPAISKRFGNAEQDTLEAGAAHGVFRRKIRSAKKWFPIRRKKRGERPSALPGNCADGGLIARVHVGPLVAIYFHGDVKLIDHGRDFWIVVTFAVNYVAPVAPHCADIEQDRLFRGASFLKSFLAPLMPVHRLMRGGTEIRAGGVFQAIFSRGRHVCPLYRGVSARRAQEKAGEWPAQSKVDYWIGSRWSASRGSIGLRPANPSSWR